jgi:hypothetical protein
MRQKALDCCGGRTPRLHALVRQCVPLSVALATVLSACLKLCRVRTQILPHIQLHAVNFREKAGRSRMIIGRMGFDLAEVGHLGLKAGNAV